MLIKCNESSLQTEDIFKDNLKTIIDLTNDQIKNKIEKFLVGKSKSYA